ncbi:MAG: dihydropyrimidine dehydrogenase, partial [Coriobacteriales bacterium]|nr:dihydropyrimidine dehydrogenase [Coriobacteriales bacterium]
MANNLTKVPMNELPIDKRIKCFDEVALGYDFDQALLEAQRCLNCKNAPCIMGCPVGVKIPNFIAALVDGNIKNSFE